jgi:hypothetical protein
MALLIENKYPGKSEPASAAYPQGAARNITAPGDGLGTPLEKEWINDLFGLQQALLAAAGLTPSGSPDTALASQYLQGIIQQVQGRAGLFDDTGAANAYIVALRTSQQAPGAVFDGQRFRIVPTVTSTGAATIDISALLGQAAATTVINIKLKGGSTDPSAGVIIAGEEIGFIYRTSPGIHAQLDSAFAGDASFAGSVDIEEFLKVGRNGSFRGKITAFGNESGSVNGGELQLFSAADYTSEIPYYFFRVIQDDLRIETDSGVVLKHEGGSGDWQFGGIVDILGGTVKLNGATMSGAQVIIADDAVALLTFPNRSFGMLSLTEGGDTSTTSDASVFFLGFVDFGVSPARSAALDGSAVETNVTVPLTGETGTDGKLTIGVAGVTGTLYIENRLGNSKTININLV